MHLIYGRSAVSANEIAQETYMQWILDDTGEVGSRHFGVIIIFGRIHITNSIDTEP